MNTPALETERLILRKFVSSDLEALYQILRDEEVNTFLPWFPMASLDDAARFYRLHYEQVYAQARGYAYAICLKSEDLPSGYVNVDIHEPHDLGYGLRKEFWHKGITTEACQAVVEQVKKDGLPYITATHDVNNPRSAKVMEQLGMTYRYAYEEQWQPKDRKVTFRLYQLNFQGEPAWTYQGYLAMNNG